jgi:hypothetical protein
VKKSKIDPFRELVGNRPDTVIAELAGLTLSAVRAYRSKHGIPRFVDQDSNPKVGSSEQNPGSSAPSRSRVAAYEDELGLLTDTVIARKAGLTIGAVRAYRVRKGISSASENKRKAKRAALEATAAALPELTKLHSASLQMPTQETTYVWSVQYGAEQTCLVRAADLADAGAVLVRTGIGDVQSVTRLGTLLEGR